MSVADTSVVEGATARVELPLPGLYNVYNALGAAALQSLSWAFLLFGAYGLVMAYRYRLVLPLLVAIVGVGAWAWSLEALVLRSPVNDTFRSA